MRVFRLHQNEREFTDTVIELAQRTGWLVHHDRPARTADGSWRTAIQGDKGFPDLVLVGHGRLIVAELKIGSRRPDAHQAAWLTAFRAAGIMAHVWRPDDWDEIERDLKS